jgi:hypothetical protein
VALVATLLNLLGWQLALLVPGRPSTSALLATLVLDAAVVAALLGLRLLVK